MRRVQLEAGLSRLTMTQLSLKATQGVQALQQVGSCTGDCVMNVLHGTHLHSTREQVPKQNDCVTTTAPCLKEDKFKTCLSQASGRQQCDFGRGRKTPPVHPFWAPAAPMPHQHGKAEVSNSRASAACSHPPSFAPEEVPCDGGCRPCL